MSKEQKKTDEQEEGPRSFAQFFSKLADGEAEREASQQLFELNKRMQEEAKMRFGAVKGSLTIKLNLNWDENDIVGIVYKVVKAEPPRRTSKSVFWGTKGGNLTPENPKQQKLGLEVVGGKSPPKEAPAPTAAKEA